MTKPQLTNPSIEPIRRWKENYWKKMQIDLERLAKDEREIKSVSNLSLLLLLFPSPAFKNKYRNNLNVYSY